MSTEIGTFVRDSSEQTKRIDPPGSEMRGKDWVLVVGDAAVAFHSPGERGR